MLISFGEVRDGFQLFLVGGLAFEVFQNTLAPVFLERLMPCSTSEWAEALSVGETRKAFLSYIKFLPR
jgi:hypothetical protein